MDDKASLIAVLKERSGMLMLGYLPRAANRLARTGSTAGNEQYCQCVCKHVRDQ
jgi:hypothetical protein